MEEGRYGEDGGVYSSRHRTVQATQQIRSALRHHLLRLATEPTRPALCVVYHERAAGGPANSRPNC